MLTKKLIYDVGSKAMREVEEEMEFPNPRISEIERRLQEIRQTLAETDYITLKHAEGGLTDTEWYNHVTFRTSLRAEYNSLEAELGGLNG